MHRATSVQDPREGREKVRRPHVHKSREHTSAAAADWPETVPSLAARQGGMRKYTSPLTSKRSAPTAATASTEPNIRSAACTAGQRRHSPAMPRPCENAAAASRSVRARARASRSVPRQAARTCVPRRNERTSSIVALLRESVGFRRGSQARPLFRAKRPEQSRQQDGRRSLSRP